MNQVQLDKKTYDVNFRLDTLLVETERSGLAGTSLYFCKDAPCKFPIPGERLARSKENIFYLLHFERLCDASTHFIPEYISGKFEPLTKENVIVYLKSRPGNLSKQEIKNLKFAGIDALEIDGKIGG